MCAPYIIVFMNNTITSFSVQDFNMLDGLSKREFYMKANETHQVDLVRKLNDMGMKPKGPCISRPGILSNFMDIATKYDTILGFFKDLRQEKRLFTKEEFQLTTEKKWVVKTKLSRILGSDHLMQEIKENRLMHIKVPSKIAVIECAEILKIKGALFTDNLYDLHTDQIKIYAEKIESVDRKLTRDEIDELIQIIAVSNFIDLWPENILIAADGIYFIDTEFKSFAGYTDWGKLGRFQELVSEEDKTYFLEKVNNKIKEPDVLKDNNEYFHLKEKLQVLNKFKAKYSNDDYATEIEEVENKISSLEYVGTSKAGYNCVRPNIFTFKLEDIFT